MHFNVFLLLDDLNYYFILEHFNSSCNIKFILEQRIEHID